MAENENKNLRVFEIIEGLSEAAQLEGLNVLRLWKIFGALGLLVIIVLAAIFIRNLLYTLPAILLGASWLVFSWYMYNRLLQEINSRQDNFRVLEELVAIHIHLRDSALIEAFRYRIDGSSRDKMEELKEILSDITTPEYAALANEILKYKNVIIH